MKFQILRLTNTDTSLIQNLIDDFLTSEENPTVEHLTKTLQDDSTYLYVATAKRKISGFHFPDSNFKSACAGQVSFSINPFLVVIIF